MRFRLVVVVALLAVWVLWGRLIDVSLRNRVLVIAAFLLLGGWGYWALLTTPIDAIPDLSDNQVIVFTDWPGRTPAPIDGVVTGRTANLGQVVGMGQELFARRLVWPFSEDGVHTRYVPKPEALIWVRSLRDQCHAASVAFFFKGWGGATPKSGGRFLDGRTWDEFPA